MDLSVITVTFNSASHITEQISSVVFACRELDYEHIIVDNASQDGTVDFLSNNTSVRIIKNTKNLGFGAAHNQAEKIARGKYLLFLNPDMKITSSIAPLIKYLDDNTRVGIVGCKLLDKNGRLNLLATPRRFPKFTEMILTILKIPHIFPKLLNSYLYRDKNFEITQPVDTIRGSFMLVRREFLNKLGWAFDPRYFLWWEDVDLCREARRLGYQVVYNTDVSCVDMVGRSFAHRNIIWKQKQFYTGMVRYFLKWR